MNYLSEEEQYKRDLNIDEVNRIKDWELREIRQRALGRIEKAWLDEHNIPDHKIGDVFKRIEEEEIKEIEEYKKDIVIARVFSYKL